MNTARYDTQSNMIQISGFHCKLIRKMLCDSDIMMVNCAHETQYIVLSKHVVHFFYLESNAGTVLFYTRQF